MSGDFNLTPGDLREGLWCQDCHDTTGIETQFVHIQPEGVEVIATLRQCGVCHGYRVRDNNEES